MEAQGRSPCKRYRRAFRTPAAGPAHHPFPGTVRLSTAPDPQETEPLVLVQPRRSTLLPWLLALAAAPGLVACASAGSKDAPAKDEADDGDEDVVDEKELVVARMELELARLEAEQELAVAEE